MTQLFTKRLGFLCSVGMFWALVTPSLPFLLRAEQALALEVPPPPRTRVVDLTATLTKAQLDNLERILAEFEQKTTTQIVVLLMRSLEGDSLEDFSIRLAERWKPGQKEKDNGVILLVVKNDRKMRIEVGYGLEGALPDVLAGSIIRTEIAPLFRKDDFYGGILAGVRAIMAATQGEYKAPKTAKREGKGGGVLSTFLLLLIILGVLAGLRRRQLGYWGLLALFFGMGRGGSSWGRGGSSGGGFGGGGFGGFSGGGGGFGGGGASGGW